MLIIIQLGIVSIQLIIDLSLWEVEMRLPKERVYREKILGRIPL